jgi:APA family basic amino acid/polyamine antiporter
MSGPAADVPLRRAVGRFDFTMMVMGSIVGAGVFNLPAKIAEQIGSPAGVLAAWALGGVFAFTGALVFAELGAMLPHSGGQYVFVREAYGRFAAFLFGWVLLTGVTGSALAYVAGVFSAHVEVLARAAGGSGDFGDGGRRALSIGLIAAVTALNARGIRLGAVIQNASMVAKIAGILGVVGLGAVVALGLAEPDVAPARAVEPASNVGGALLAVVFAYGGWQNATCVAGEVRDPARTVPLGTLAGTVGVIALYLAFNVALLAILGVDGVAATGTPTSAAADALLPGAGAVVAALVAISAFGFVQGVSMLAPRAYYAMARDGAFFGAAAKVHPRWRTPVLAIVIQGAVGAAHVLYADGLGDLVDVCMLCDLVFFASCGVALFLLRRRRPDAPRPYRALGYPWLPLVFVAVSGSLAVQALFTTRVESVGLAAGVFGAGVVAYAAWSRRGLPAPRD